MGVSHGGCESHGRVCFKVGWSASLLEVNNVQLQICSVPHCMINLKIREGSVFRAEVTYA